MEWPEDPPHSRPGWVYRLLRWIDRAVLQTWFSDMGVLDFERIPDEGGVLFVSWHPGAMIDPSLMFGALPGRLTFVAKHTLFHIPGLGAIMRAAGAQPVVRPGEEDGDPVERAQANAQMISAVATQVGLGHRAAIFPEGLSHFLPSPSRIRRGAARVLIKATRVAEAEGQAPPSVVPIGLHYTDQHRFREQVVLKVHRPVELPPLPGRPGSPEPSEALREEHGDEAADRAWVEAVTCQLMVEVGRASQGLPTWDDRHIVEAAVDLWIAFGGGAGSPRVPLTYTRAILAQRRFRAGWMWLELKDRPQAAALHLRMTALAQRMERFDLTAEDLAQRAAPPRRRQLTRGVLSWIVAATMMTGVVTWAAFLGGALPARVLMWIVSRAPDERAVGSYKFFWSIVIYPGWWTILSGPLAWFLASPTSPVWTTTWLPWHIWGEGPGTFWLTPWLWILLTPFIWFAWPMAIQGHLWLWGRATRSSRRVRRWFLLRDESVPWTSLRREAESIAHTFRSIGAGLVLPADPEWVDPESGTDDHEAMRRREPHEMRVMPDEAA